MRYYNKDGEVIDQGLWTHLFEDFDYRRVALDVLPNGKMVSTVWLGIDHSFGLDKPLIFECMVFGSTDTSDDLEQYRYSTEQEAINGHADAVARWSL